MKRELIIKTAFIIGLICILQYFVSKDHKKRVMTHEKCEKCISQDSLERLVAIP